MSHDVRTSRLGSHLVSIECDDPTFWSFAERRYGRFFVEGVADQPVEGGDHLEVRIVDDDLAEGRSPKDGEVVMHPSRGLVTMRWDGLRARWDLARRHAIVELARRDLLPPRAAHGNAPFGVEAVWKHVLARRGLASDLLVVHSACVLRRGGGYLFVGPSGAGKSTICALSQPPAHPLSDDFSLVRLGEDGAEVIGTPFCSVGGMDGRPGHGPLRAICVLVQAPVPAWRKLSAGQALAHVLGETVCAPGDVDATQRILDIASRLCSTVPCGALEFRKDPDFWEVLDA